MFFIGGFNTVLPHLLYISLIWAFLIIGLSGKLNVLRYGKTIQTENSFICLNGNNTIHYSLKVFDSKVRENGVLPFYFTFLKPVGTFTPKEIASVVTETYRHLHSNPFRGPPLIG